MEHSITQTAKEGNSKKRNPTDESSPSAQLLKPGPGEVLVRMSATSINPIDWKLRRGDLKAVMPLQFPQS